MTCRILVPLAILTLMWCVDGARGAADGDKQATTRPAGRATTRPALDLVYPFPLPAVARAPATAPAGRTEDICQAAIDWLDRASPMVDKLVPVAEAAAERLLAGGTLYVAGNGGFVDEYDYRAGGFPFVRIWLGQKLESNDVLLIGNFRPNETENRHAQIDFVARGYGRRFGKAMVVYLSSHRWLQISRSLPMVNKPLWRNRLCLVDTGAPEGGSASDLCVGQLSAAALGWVLHGEMISAATRRGKTLATYASDWEPAGRAWDASVKGHHEHPKYKVPPIPAGKIGREYLRTCRKQIADFRATQCEQVRLAGRRMAECMERGGLVWAVFSAHILPRGVAVPAALTRVKVFGRSYDWGYFARRTRKEDMVLWMGYLRYPKWAVDGARRSGCGAVIVSVDDGPTNERLTHVRGCWKNYDTVIDLPDYPIRVLPSSGVVQTPQWYALMAETVAAQQALR